MEKLYKTISRPGLQNFLDFLFKNFDVSIWTAASKDYALFIIDNIILSKEDRKLKYVFFSYHRDITEERKGNTKDLSLLYNNIPHTFNKNNTIIIDDYDEVKKTNKDNCINIKPFIFKRNNSENDKELKYIEDSLIKWKNDK